MVFILFNYKYGNNEIMKPKSLPSVENLTDSGRNCLPALESQLRRSTKEVIAPDFGATRSWKTRTKWRAIGSSVDALSFRAGADSDAPSQPSAPRQRHGAPIQRPHAVAIKAPTAAATALIC